MQKQDSVCKFDESSQSCLANGSFATFVLQLLINSDGSVAKFARAKNNFFHTFTFTFTQGNCATILYESYSESYVCGPFIVFSNFCWANISLACPLLPQSGKKTKSSMLPLNCLQRKFCLLI